MNEIFLTKKSKNLVEHIVRNMEGKTFHHHFHILYDILTTIRKPEINYLEIGTYCGASTSLVLSHPKKISAICIDTFSEAPTDLVERNLNKFKNINSNYELLVGDSKDDDIIKKTKSKTEEVDLFYIDGDHSFQGCLEDFLNFSDLITPGGYVVFDDYHDVNYSPQVKHAVDYIVSDFLFDQFEVIGSFRNSLKVYPSEMVYNNQFIIRKK